MYTNYLFRAVLDFTLGDEEGRSVYPKRVVIPCSAVTAAGACWFEMEVFAGCFTEKEMEYLEEYCPEIFCDEDQVYCDGRVGPKPILERCMACADKNDTPIFIGDILKHTHTETGFTAVGALEEDRFGLPVFHDREHFTFCEEWGDVIHSVFINGKSTLEVLGNLHENPELLGVRQ